MKYYLDTSSLAKIYHDEEGSSHALELYKSNAIISVSELAVLEFLSTIHRRYREKDIIASSLEELLLKFTEDVDIRYELLPFSPFVFETGNGASGTGSKEYRVKARLEADASLAGF